MANYSNLFLGAQAPLFPTPQEQLGFLPTGPTPSQGMASNLGVFPIPPPPKPGPTPLPSNASGQIQLTPEEIGYADLLNQAQSVIGQYGADLTMNKTKLGKLAKERGKNVRELGDIKAEEANKSAQVYAGLQKNITDADEEIKRISSSYEESRNNSQNEINRAREELKEANKINPNAYFERIGIGGAILSALSVGLGAFGSSLAGGPNIAAQMMMKSIDNDIQAQIEKRNGLRDLIADMRTSLGEQRSKYLSDLDIIKFKQMQMRDATQTKLLELAKRSEGTQAGLLAKDAAAVLEQENIKTSLELSEKMAEARFKGLALESDIVSTGQKVAAAGATQKDLENRLAQVGLKGRPITEKLLNDAVAIKGTTEILKEQAKQLDAELAGVGSEILPSNKAKQLSSLAEQIRVTLREVNNMGVPSGKDQETLEKILARDPTQLRQGVVRAQLQNIIRQADLIKKTRLKNAGLSEVSEDIDKKLDAPVYINKH